MKKKLLIYAHYYAPDIASTGQIITELAEGLLNYFEIVVICAVPSYSGIIEEKYKKRKYYKEEINGVQILRVRVPEFYKGNKVSRVKNIITYFFRSMKATCKVDNQDYVFTVSQPPILGGLLGVWGKWIKKAKYIYQVQDWNPCQATAVGYIKSQFIRKLMLALDKFSCKQADLVITVGRDMIETLKQRFTNKYGVISKDMPRAALINNWIDETKIYPLKEEDKQVLEFRKKNNLNGKFVIMYSGNLGLYYDLENILKVIRKFDSKTRTAISEKYPYGQEVAFAFVGDGAVKNKLVLYKKQHSMSNVVFIPYQDKENVLYSLNAGDVHWCVNAKGIKGACCPSKYYGIAAVGKPVLGVLEKGTEIRCLIEETNSGLVCEPGDYKAIEKNIDWFLKHAGEEKLKIMGQRGHQYLIENLTKEKSIKKYREEILKC